MKIPALRKIIREELIKNYLFEFGDCPGTDSLPDGAKALVKEDDDEVQKDVDYNVDATGAKVTGKMAKAMDPNASAKEFAIADEKIDKSGTPKEQAGMLAKFALDYVEGDTAEATSILKLASTTGIKGLGTTAPEDEAAEGDAASEDAGEDFKKGMSEGLSKSRMIEIIKEEIASHYLATIRK
tara:strand:+ start:8840 stop:9388 length:549 start_codon:yes stop_codon:yes gene_type:complete